MRIIAGVDEVGVGAIAGPIVAVCVALRVEADTLEEAWSWWPIAKVKDSKLTSEGTRNKMSGEITDFVLSNGGGVGVGSSRVSHINNVGYTEAIQDAINLAVSRAIGDLGEAPEVLIVDGDNGVTKYSGKQKVEPKADKNYFVVALASIMAKLIRDGKMIELAKSFPGYWWDRNKGYPTPQHKDGLSRLGPTIHHRSQPTETVLKKHKSRRIPPGW